MPRIFDNIDEKLLPTLQEALSLSKKADFCVGYFNLRGWKKLDSHIQHWTDSDGICRLLVGMQRPPEDELREAMSFLNHGEGMDNQTAIRLKKRLAEEFRRQLAFGAPNNEDEAGLNQLAHRLKEKKVVVKLFLRHPLHAKLYLLFRPDPIKALRAVIVPASERVRGDAAKESKKSSHARHHGSRFAADPARMRRKKRG